LKAQVNQGKSFQKELFDFRSTLFSLARYKITISFNHNLKEVDL